MVLISTLVNVLGLASSLWLGFYILTRSPRSHISWLATLTLWSLTSYFLHNSLAIHLPGSNILIWFRAIILLVVPFWLHLALELTSRGASPARGSFFKVFTFVELIIAYGFAFSLIVSSIVFPRSILETSALPRLYTSDPVAGPFYPLVLILLVLVMPLILYVLYRGRRMAFSAHLRKQFTLFLTATAIASAGGFYIAVGSSLGLPLPMFPGDAVLAIGVTMLGYTVAKYNALIEGRRVEREFLYAMLAVGLLTSFYMLITLVLFRMGQISFLTLILTLIGSLSFNSLYDGVRVALDRIFYRGQFEQLRSNLRALARDAGAQAALNPQLQAILDSFCRALQVRHGFVALKSRDRFVVAATLDAHPVGTTFPLDSLSASEIIGLVRPERKGLTGIALLVPLYGEAKQIGAIALGEKETSQPYSDSELEFLDEIAEMARMIHTSRLQEDNIQKINAMIAQYRERERELELQLQGLLSARTSVGSARGEEEMVQRVEDALRHLHDFSFLGEHELGRLRLVQDRLKKMEATTFIDRGKALSQVLHDALEKIRPEGPEPGAQHIPPRDWHPYIILRDSYVNDEPNRNTMSRLYIGEGTFNRTRRRAIRSVARALQEMDRRW